MLLKANKFSARHKYLVISFMVLSCAGCISVYTKQSFPVEQIQSIRPGTTTKQEILKWFGPPVAMARKGQSIRVPSFTNSDGDSQAMVLSDVLGFFPTKHKEANLVVYLYQYWKSEITSMYIGFASLEEGPKTACQLWVLFDEDKNIAVDAVERMQKLEGM
jgi:hypothetical protein